MDHAIPELDHGWHTPSHLESPDPTASGDRRPADRREERSRVDTGFPNGAAHEGDHESTTRAGLVVLFSHGLMTDVSEIILLTSRYPTLVGGVSGPCWGMGMTPLLLWMTSSWSGDSGDETTLLLQAIFPIVAGRCW